MVSSRRPVRRLALLISVRAIGIAVVLAVADYPIMVLFQRLSDSEVAGIIISRRFIHGSVEVLQID
jgi:hypothetical protein